MQGKPVYVFESRDGSQVRVFAADHQDEAGLHDLLERATPQHRLTTGVSQSPTPSGMLATSLLDGNVWVAISGDDQPEQTIVAVGRFSPARDGEVEVSVVVRDDMQGRGIGSRLLYFVLDQARASGARKALTSFESSNEAAWQVMQYSPYHMTWQPRGKQIDVVIHLQARASAGTTMN